MPRFFPLISRRRSLDTPEAVLAFRLAEAGITARLIRTRAGVTHRRANALVTARVGYDADFGPALAQAFHLAADALTKPLSVTEARDWSFYLKFSRNRSRSWQRIARLLDLTGTPVADAAQVIGLHRTQLSRGLARGNRAPNLTYEQVARLFDAMEIVAAPELLLTTTTLLRFIKPDRVDGYRARQRAIRLQRALHRRYHALRASGSLPPLRAVAAAVDMPPQRLRSYVMAKAPARLKHVPTTEEINRLRRYLRCPPARIDRRGLRRSPKPTP
jgi:hypothetical protein